MNTIIAGFIGPQEIIVIFLSVGLALFILVAIFIIFRSTKRSKNRTESINHYKKPNQ